MLSAPPIGPGTSSSKGRRVPPTRTCSTGSWPAISPPKPRRAGKRGASPDRGRAMDAPPRPAPSAFLGPWPPAAVAASRRLLGRLTGQRTAVAFVIAVGAVNVSSLVGNGLAFRWIEPAAMGTWHTLLLLNSYLTFVRLG